MSYVRRFSYVYTPNMKKPFLRLYRAIAMHGVARLKAVWCTSCAEKHLNEVPISSTVNPMAELAALMTSSLQQRKFNQKMTYCQIHRLIIPSDICLKFSLKFVKFFSKTFTTKQNGVLSQYSMRCHFYIIKHFPLSFCCDLE